MPGFELIDGVDAEQLHGAHDLRGEDRDGMVHTCAAPGRQHVQLGAADEGELRAERDRGHDVGAGHDAGVD